MNERDLKRVIKAKPFAIVIGSAITRPLLITKIMLIHLIIIKIFVIPATNAIIIYSINGGGYMAKEKDSYLSNYRN